MPKRCSKKIQNYKEHWKKDPEKKVQTTSFRTETFFCCEDARVAISKEDFIELMEDEWVSCTMMTNINI